MHVDWLAYFKNTAKENPDMATAVVAIHTLIAFIEASHG